MTDHGNMPHIQDVASVGSRIRWGAIFAGAVFAAGVYFLLGILGSAVGLSISERVNPTTLKTAAIAWVILTLIVSVFTGGAVTSQFTVGETKMEAVLYGIIMWALLFGFLVGLGAAGVRAGYNTLVGIAHAADTTTSVAWEKLAQDAGVPADQIENWRRSVKTGQPQDTQNQEATREAATRISWYAFGATWGSMIAAALGALIGAGPTFKVVTVRSPAGLTTR